MAFCKQCGTNLDGAKFCPSCGAAADGEIVPQSYHSPASVNADIRRQSLAEMNDMIRHFGAKSEQYYELDTVTAEIDKRSAKGYWGFLISGIITALLGYWMFTNSSGVFLARIFFSFCIPAASIAAFVLLRKKNKEKLDAARLKQSRLNKELDDLYNAYGYCSIGAAYTHPVILGKINNVIREGRANTPEGAINILLDDIRKDKMEQLAQVTAEAAASAAISAAQTERNTRKAANYASASFWFKD